VSVPHVDVRDLVGAPGASRTREVLGTLDGLAGELVTVPDDAPVRAELLLESLVDGILVEGSVEGTWSVRCARCLSAETRPFRTEVHELFAVDATGAEDVYAYDPETGLDLEQMLRDAIGLEMPFAPLCRPDCLGLCETCGGNRNLGECPGHERLDPRFAVLSELVLPDPEP
jgi:uncharacterized protein